MKNKITLLVLRLVSVLAIVGFAGMSSAEAAYYPVYYHGTCHIMLNGVDQLAGSGGDRSSVQQCYATAAWANANLL